MFSLELKISNFEDIEGNPCYQNEIELLFGSIETTLKVSNGQAGSIITLELEQKELIEIKNKFVFGLFIQDINGKYFCLLSLQKISLDHIIRNSLIRFYDQNDLISHTCRITLKFNFQNVFKAPKRQKIQQVQNLMKLLKKQQTYHEIDRKKKDKKKNQSNFKGFQSKTKDKNNVESYHKKDKISSFSQIDRKNIENKINPATQQNLYVPVKNRQQSNNFEYFVQEEYVQPPIMQFINTMPSLNQINILPQSQERQISSQKKNPKQFSVKIIQKTNLIDVSNQSKQTQVLNIKKKLTKKQLRQMAELQVMSRDKDKDKNTNIMIPIAKGDTFTLIPLSELSADQIAQYVRKQKYLQQQKQKYQIKNKQKIGKVQNNNITKMIPKKTPITYQQQQKDPCQLVVKQVKQQNDLEFDQGDKNYESDFESISMVNSAIKSKHSSRTKNKIDQSILDYSYSQDFDSYSQSLINRSQNRQSFSQMNDSKNMSQSQKNQNN